MTTAQKIHTIKQAIALVEQASQLVEEVSGNNAHYTAYGRYGFDQLLQNGNQYDASLFTLIAELENE